jgi:hypothetical protein
MSKVFFPANKLLALSWKQPFASLMLHGKIETRKWATNYRGWVLICATKVPYHIEQLFEIAGPIQYDRIWATLDPDEQEDGVALAIGRLVDCRPMSPVDEDKCFVQYYPGLFCHTYEDVSPIVPMPWKGSQGWKEVPWEIKGLITKNL